MQRQVENVKWNGFIKYLNGSWRQIFHKGRRTFDMIRKSSLQDQFVCTAVQKSILKERQGLKLQKTHGLRSPYP